MQRRSGDATVRRRKAEGSARKYTGNEPAIIVALDTGPAVIAAGCLPLSPSHSWPIRQAPRSCAFRLIAPVTRAPPSKKRFLPFRATLRFDENLFAFRDRYPLLLLALLIVELDSYSFEDNSLVQFNFPIE